MGLKLQATLAVVTEENWPHSQVQSAEDSLGFGFLI